MATTTKRDVFKVGKRTLEIKSVTDDQTNIETLTITMTAGKKKTEQVIEKDMTTGKILPPKLPEAVRNMGIVGLMRQMSAIIDMRAALDEPDKKGTGDVREPDKT